MGVTINSLSSARRQAGAEYLLLDSDAQLHTHPIKCPRQLVPLPDPGIHTASGARFQYDGGRLVRFKLPEGRLSMRAQGREFVFCLRDADGALGDTWCELRHRQELQMPIGPWALEDVEKSMLSRPATLKDPGSHDQIVLDQSETFPESALVRSARRISRTRLSTSRSVENRRSGATTSVWLLLHGGLRPSADCVFLVRTDTSSGTMVPDTKKMDMPYVVAGTAKWRRDLEYERLCPHGDKEGVPQLLLDQVAKEYRPEGQDLQIPRQVSPTQSDQSNGAAEKAVSTVCGLARLKDKIPSSDVTTHSSMLPWTIKHAAWVLERYNLRRDTRMTPYEKICGQKYKEIPRESQSATSSCAVADMPMQIPDPQMPKPALQLSPAEREDSIQKSQRPAAMNAVLTIAGIVSGNEISLTDDQKAWHTAKLKVLLNMDTICVVESQSQKNLSTRWVSKQRLDASYSMRLVARGFEQTVSSNADFFAGTSKLTTLHRLFTMTGIHWNPIAFGDCHSAFHQSTMPSGPEPVYVDSSKVWLCKKAHRPDSTQKINDMSYDQLISDPSTYVKKRKQRSDDSILLRLMDDKIGTGPQKHLVSDFESVKTSLYLTDVERLRKEDDTVNFLSLEITKTSRDFEKKNSTDLVESLLNLYGLEISKSTVNPERRSTVMELATAIPLTDHDYYNFRISVGELMFTTPWRPDMQFVI